MLNIAGAGDDAGDDSRARMGNPRRRIEKARDALLAMRARSAAANATATGATSAPSPAASG